MRTAFCRPELCGLAIQAAEAKIFHLEELFDSVMRSLAAQSRLFDTSKWCNFVGDQAGVNAHHSAFQAFGYPPDPADIATKEIACKSEFGVIGKTDRIFVGIESEQGRQRTKCLFVRDFHLRSDVSQY